MGVNLPKDPMFVPDFEYKGATNEEIKELVLDLEEWLSELCRSLEEYFKKAYRDITLGTSTHKVVTTTPTTTNVDNGEFVVLSAGTASAIYTKISGTLYKVTLTAA